MNIQELDQKAKRLAKNYIRLESELLAVIMEVDKRKAFYKLGYSSLHQYVMEGLKLSAGQAVPFVNVARKAAEVPELKTEIENGLSIYKAQKMTSVLTKDNHKQWFKVANEKNHRQLEREVAIASPRNAVPTTAKYLPLGIEVPEKVTYKTSAPCLHLQMSIPEKTMLLIRRVEDLECQRQKCKVELAEVLEIMTNLYLDKNDPVRKAKRQKAKGKLAEEIKSEEGNSQELGSYSEGMPEQHQQMDLNEPESWLDLKYKDGVAEQANEIKLESNNSQSAKQSAAGNLGSNLSRDKSSISKMKSNGINSFLDSKNVSTLNKRHAFSAKIIHQVQLRDEGQCTFRRDGKRCANRRHLEIHHIHPVAKGGNNNLENLTLLCSGHHKVLHANGE